MYAQSSMYGIQYLLLKAIDYHESDEHVAKQERLIVVDVKPDHPKTTAAGTLAVKWNDGSTSWEKQSDLKESVPIKVAE